MAVVTFDGVELKCPSSQELEGQQAVDSARNALMEVVAQPINRRQLKVNYSWNVLYPKELQTIAQCIEKFSGVARVYNPLTAGFVNREMYWGDYKVSTYWTFLGGEPKMFTGMTASLIDMGKPDRR